MKETVLNSGNIREYGRNYEKDGILRLIHSGSGAGFSFTGKKLILTVGADSDVLASGRQCNYPRVAIMADGRFVVKKIIEKRREQFVIVDEASPVTKNIRIVKLSEAAFSIAELYPAETDDDAIIEPVPEKPLKIEFIGDSITCGYGVDDSNFFSDFSTMAENAMKSYGVIAADMLNADYSLFAYSGYGIISGYTHDGRRNTRELLPPYYRSIGFSESTVDGTAVQGIDWDFSRFRPDIIVVNLGTNDNSFCIAERGGFAELSAAYAEFIRCVRQLNPSAKIVCTIGIIDVETAGCIISAAESLGDPALWTFRFSPQTGLLGYGSNMHPSEDTHICAAEELVGFIRSNVL